ncbi:hypothetical protein [Chryseobacterium sp.]|uniref:hypothetical protein n=1 Tax=Chryseobacterium sp. TaxID=1871047 RepID=UPI00321A226A
MPRNYLLLTIPFLLLSCKQEVKNTEPHIADKTVSEQKIIKQETINKEVVEQKKLPSLDLNAEWEGVYSYCVDDVRTDEFKSVTCYEISIFKDEVTVDGNTTICTGTYSIRGNKEEIELRYAGNDCEDHFFKLKKKGGKVMLYDFMNPDQAREVKIN